MPKPPIWMSTRIATWPATLQYVGVSTTASPVTHVALTAVNRATPGLADPGPVRIIGSISSRVPRPHRIAKDRVMERAGDRRAIRACWACERATTWELP